MKASRRAAEATWLATLASWRLYFRYSVEGLEHLMARDCRLVVGYHGRPLAWDLFMLGAEVHRRCGYLPVALVHRNFEKTPYLRWLTDELGWATGRGAVLDDAIARGRHVILAPGGEREGLRRGDVRYQVDWGNNIGYLRLAIKRGLDIVPVGASGVDDTYFGLVDGHALKKRVAPRVQIPLWSAVGPMGLYPYSPPFPAKIHQIVGAPIPAARLAQIDLGDETGLMNMHREVQDQVQGLVDRARHAVARDRAARFDRLRQLRFEGPRPAPADA